ncbi:MAG: D-alanyl-D-alanine carboxypeptidase family protein [Actinomycetales bacterium]
MSAQRRVGWRAVLVAVAWAVFAACLPGSASAAEVQGLSSGQSLSATSHLRSPNGLYTAQLNDGNLVVWRSGFGTQWRSGTAPVDPGLKLQLRTDGNLMLITGSGKVRWASKVTGFTPSGVRLGNDGNLAVLRSDGTVAWSTKTSTPQDSTDVLPSGAAVVSASGAARATMQQDGNLVVYKDGQAIWESGTGGNGGARMVVTPGLGVAIVSLGNRVLWAAGTSTDDNSRMAIGDDGNFVVYNPAGEPVWGTIGPRPGTPGVQLDCSKVTGPVPVEHTTVVYGIRVHQCVADRVKRMMDDAYAAGAPLSGTGWRDYNRQVELRIQNCGGNTYYNVYQKPSSQCSPPTAIPGRSMHERGLAIDFRTGSRAIYGSDVQFAWLKANAAKYGFYNLPSETWHWSTNGS